MADELFAFDDFFVDANDPGIENPVKLKDRNGNEREMTIRTKRALTLGDREAAKTAATTAHIDPTKGTLVIDGFDQGEFTVQLLSRAILSWPFERVTRNEAGDITGRTRVPVTIANLRQMQAENGDALTALVASLMNGVTAESMPDFVKPSEGLS